MGLTSDSETESMSMKSKIDKMNVQAIIDNRDEDVTQTKNYNNDNDKNVEYSLKTDDLNITRDCTFPGCGKSFHKPSRLLWHIRQHTGVRVHKCSFQGCDKSYTSQSHLKRHQKVHETVHVAVVCGICQLTLKNRSNLLRHHRRAHENKNRLSCEVCGISFRKKYKLDEHMSLIHDRKLMKCNKCDREFKNLVHLKRHEKLHDRQYECPEDNCKVILKTFMEFRRHAKTHPKEHICDKCNKKFVFTYQYNRHLKTHEGKLLACPYEDCHKTYFHSNALKAHVRATHEIPKLECDLCKNTFVYKVSLRKHMQIIHLNENSSKPKVYKKGEERKIRKDVGKQTRSMPSVLTGVFLPSEVEKMIINRDTKIKLSDTNFECVEDGSKTSIINYSNY